MGPKAFLATVVLAISLLALFPAEASAARHTGEANWLAFAGPALAHELRQAERQGDAATRRDRAALVEFYQARDFRPLWIEAGKLTAKARRAVFFLSRADAYGLDPAAYATPPLGLGMAEPAPASAIAAAEIKMSLALLAYARQASGGRLDPASVSKAITHAPQRPDPSAALARLASSGDTLATLIDFNPPHPAFKVLRDKLAELRQLAAEGGWPVIGSGPTLKPGQRDARVVTLKQRFAIAMPPPLIADPAEVELYDGEVVEAVKAFQRDHGLEVDGIVGPATTRQLGMTVADRIDQLLATMEHWRWAPRTLGSFYVLVDIPGFRVQVVENGAPVHETKVVVGQPTHQTPVFSDTLEYVEVNPYWNVPYSIATQEMLPQIRRDPGYFAKRDFEVFPAWGRGTGQIDPRTVNWSQLGAANFPYRFRQPPGPKNALGRIKFMFPNQHSVYLHDTPAKSLFGRTVRTFSHGCVRVENPLGFAAALLKTQPAPTIERVERELATGRNRALPLAEKIPVHLTYFTAWVEDGQVRFRDDVYGHDARVAAALGQR